MLTAILERYCRTAGIEPGTLQYELTGQRIIALFQGGAHTEDEMLASLDGNGTAPSNGTFCTGVTYVRGGDCVGKWHSGMTLSCWRPASPERVGISTALPSNRNLPTRDTPKPT